MALNFVFLGVSDKDICINGPEDATFSSLLDGLTRRGIDTSLFHYTHNGSPIEDLSNQLDVTPSENESHLVIVRAYSQLYGGKGGFGALIRAMGMRMNRNRNKDACRDLTGRRLRSINTEKRVADLLKKEPEKRRKQAEEKAEKRRLLLEGPRHKFNDQGYLDQLEAAHESLEGALKQGLATTSGCSSSKGKGSGSSSDGETGRSGKRKADHSAKHSNKKAKLWMDMENDSDLTDSEEGEDDSTGSSSSPSTNCPDPTTKEATAKGIDLGIPILPPVDVPTVDSSIGQNDSSSQSVSPDNSKPSHTLLSDHTPSTSLTDNTDIVTDADHQLIPPFSFEQFDLDSYSNVEELAAIGGDNLKLVLQKKGLKCGGTPQQRAQRLWAVKGKELSDIDPSLLAVSSGKGRTRNRGKKN